MAQRTGGRTARVRSPRRRGGFRLNTWPPRFWPRDRISRRRIRGWRLRTKVLAVAGLCATLFGAANGGWVLWGHVSETIFPPKVLGCVSLDESALDLTSVALKDNLALQAAFDNCPPLRRGVKCEYGTDVCKDAVSRVQERLEVDGFALPLSKKANGKFDGVFGSETEVATESFQKKHKLKKDGEGVVGRETLGLLDKLAQT